MTIGPQNIPSKNSTTSTPSASSLCFELVLVFDHQCGGPRGSSLKCRHHKKIHEVRKSFSSYLMTTGYTYVENKITKMATINNEAQPTIAKK